MTADASKIIERFILDYENENNYKIFSYCKLDI